MGASYHEQLWRRIPLPKFRVELTYGSMTAHQIRIHRTESAIDWKRMLVSQMEHLPQLYNTSFPKGMTQCPCPFHGCPGSSRTWKGPQNHFNWQKWGNIIIILEDHPSPLLKWYHYIIQLPPWRLDSRHYES